MTEPNILVVAGLVYGDEGKGSIVDFLVRRHQAGLVVRYNGGPQAAHNVITPDGLHHTFSQFGSGTLVPGVKTYLSRFMLVNPRNMMNEASVLTWKGITDALVRTTVDEDALVITPFHRIVNKEIERARGNKRHGSCGEGVGTAREQSLKYPDVIRVRDLVNEKTVKRKLRWTQEICQKELSIQAPGLVPEGTLLFNGRICNDLAYDYTVWARSVKIVSSDWLGLELANQKAVVFEGAQGVLLDETWGEKDHNTWTDTTFNNADLLISEARTLRPQVTKIGVMRTYFTRHGEGTFTEGTVRYPEDHNRDDGFQGRFKMGPIDFDKLRYSAKVCGGVDEIAFNHMDREVCDTRRIEQTVDAPITIMGGGPSASDKYLVKICDAGEAFWNKVKQQALKGR
jgi:adenylosuccinate synthase